MTLQFTCRQVLKPVCTMQATSLSYVNPHIHTHTQTHTQPHHTHTHTCTSMHIYTPAMTQTNERIDFQTIQTITRPLRVIESDNNNTITGSQAKDNIHATPRYTSFSAVCRPSRRCTSRTPLASDSCVTATSWRGTASTPSAAKHQRRRRRRQQRRVKPSRLRNLRELPS